MIHTAAIEDKKRIIDTLVLGMSADPVLRWYFPESHSYLANIPTFMDLIGGAAFEQGTAFHTDDFSCTALWLPPNVHPDAEAIQQFLTDKLDGCLLQRARALEEQFSRLDPENPCWHLAVIACDPAHIGKGLGSELIRHVLRICDECRYQVYLVSSSPANARLYERFGFRKITEITAPSTPSVIAMMRGSASG